MASELKRNWKTSLAGAIYIVTLLVTTSGDFTPEQQKWARVVEAAAVGAGFMASRDHNK